MISNDNQCEQTDEILLNDGDQITISSIVTTITTDEPIDDRTKYGEKRR